MEKKNSQMYNIDIKNTKEIYDFCLLNKIMDIDGFINKCFKKGFNIEKYGLIGEDSGKTDGIGEKQTEIEVIREIRVEVPVEVIKEVTVESNNDKSLMLQETLNKLRKELTEKNSKITELEGTIKKLEQTNINQGAAYMKGSNLTKNI